MARRAGKVVFLAVIVFFAVWFSGAGYSLIVRPFIFSKLKQAIIAGVEKNLKATLQIGKIGGELLSKIEFQDIVLKDKENNQVLATVRVASIRYDLRKAWRYRKAPQKMLTQIELKDGYIKIERDQKGVLNWQKILPPPPKKKAPPPEILLSWRIQNLTAELADYSLDPVLHEKVKINASGDNKFFPVSFIKGRVVHEAGQIFASAQLDLKRNSLIAIAKASIDAASLAKYVPQDLPVAVRGGKLEVTGFANTGAEFSKPQLIAFFKARALTAKQPKLGKVTVNAEGIAYEDMVHFSFVKAKGVGKEAEAEGWLLDYLDPFFIAEGEAKVNARALEPFLARKQRLHGKLKVRFVSGGPVDDPALHAEVRGNIASREASLTHIRASVDYAKKKASLASTLSTMGGEVKIKGSVGLEAKQPRGSFVASFQQVDLARAKLTPQQLLLQGKLDGVAWLGFSSPLQVISAIDIKDPGVKRQKLDQFVGLVYFRKNRAHLLQSYAKREKNEVFGTGVVDIAKKEVLASIDGFNLNPLQLDFAQPLPVKNWEAPLFFHGSIKGSLKTPSIKARAFVGPSSFQFASGEGEEKRFIPFAWQGAEILAEGNMEELKLSATLSQDGGIFSAQGWLKPKIQNLDVALRGEDIAAGDAIDRVMGEEKDLDLNLQFEGKLSGSFENPQGKLHITLSPLLQLGKAVFDGGELQVSLENKKLKFSDARISVQNDPLELEGFVDTKEKKIDFQVSGKNWKLEKLGIEDIAGTVNFQAKMKGAFSDHSILLNVKSDKIVAKGNPLKEVSIQANLKKQKDLKGSSPIPRYTGSFSQQASYVDGKIFSKGTIETGDEEAPIKIDGKTIWENIPIVRLVENIASQEDITGTTRGEIDYSLEFKPKPPISDFYPYPKLSGQFSLEKGHLGQWPYDVVQARFSYNDNIYSLTPFFLKTPSGNLQIQGDFNPRGDVNMQLIAQDIQLGIIRKLPIPSLQAALSATPFEGLANMQILVRGNVKNPEMVGVVKSEGVQLANEKIDHFIASWKYLDNYLELKRILVESGKESVLIAGRLPFAWETKRPSAQKPVDLKLEFPSFSLERLARFVPFLREGSGQGRGTVHLTGTLAHPKWDGQIKIEGKDILLQNLNTPIENLNVNISLDQSEIVLKNLKAHLGGGTIEAHGEASLRSVVENNQWRGWTPASIRASVRSSGSPKLSIPPSFEGRIDLELDSDTEKGTSTVSGSITASDATYLLLPSEKEFQPEQLSSFLQNLQFDLAFRVGDNFWVKNDKLSMLMKTEDEQGLVFRGTLVHPSISGALVSNRGTMTLYSKRFKMKEAAVFFEQINSLEPSIFARVETTVKDKNREEVPIEIVVDGPASNMGVNIRSPHRKYRSKTESELLALLIGTQQLEENPKQAVSSHLEGTLFNWGQVAMLDQLQRKIEETLGLKEFSVEFGAGGGYQITIKEEVYPRLTLGFKGSVGETTSQELGIDYQIPGLAKGVNPTRLIVQPTRSLFYRLFPRVVDLTYSLHYSIRRQQGARDVQTGGLKAEFQF